LPGSLVYVYSLDTVYKFILFYYGISEHCLNVMNSFTVYPQQRYEYA